MLSTTPTEIQSHIVSFLPRRDAATFARTNQHFHAVTVSVLYRHVKLRSVERVMAFFGSSSLLPVGSMVAAKHADSKRAQWEAIRTLEINLGNVWSQQPLSNLSRSLRKRGLEPVPLDRLRLAYGDDPTFLLSLVQCFRPREMELCRFSPGDDLNFDWWTSAIGWKDEVTQLTLVEPDTRGRIGSASTATRFLNVKTATIICLYHGHSSLDPERAVRRDLEVLLHLCPNAEEVEIHVASYPVKYQVDTLVKNFGKDGSFGKPSSFFKVKKIENRLGCWGYDVW